MRKFINSDFRWGWLVFLIFLGVVLGTVVLGLGDLGAKALGDNPDGLRIYDSTISFAHFDYQLNPDHTLKAANPESIVSTTFKTMVLENRYLKVTLLPEFGGRIISLIYKPTGHEELYQNPIGTPYGMKNGSFYYDWLMVYGGIFPTFPEPEHGKTWLLAWKSRVVTQSAEEIGVEMSFTDDIAWVKGIPRKFNKGETGIACVATVSLLKDKPWVRLGIKLKNRRAEPVNYEYWTCTTLAPGSEPGKTLSPANSEIIAPIDQALVKDDWWRWMGFVDEPTQWPHVFKFKKLSLYANWIDMGIAYAYPGITKSWWGVINHENEEGLFRIANNQDATPGLKLWTWGSRQGKETDPKTFGNSARPYIELWAGHSPEFFKNATLSPNEEKAWDEYYIPSVGMEKVTFANEQGFIALDQATDSQKNTLIFTAKVFSTHPGEALTVAMVLRGVKKYELGSETFTGDPKAASEFHIEKPKKSFVSGKYSYELVLKSENGEVLAQAEIPVVIKK